MGNGIAENQDLVETGVQNGACSQDQHDNSGRHDQGQGNGERLPDTSGPINTGRFVELFIQPGNSRHIDDRAPTGFLPDVQNDHHGLKQIRPAQKVDGFIHNVQGHQQIVQRAAL